MHPLVKFFGFSLQSSDGEELPTLLLFWPKGNFLKSTLLELLWLSWSSYSMIFKGLNNERLDSSSNSLFILITSILCLLLKLYYLTISFIFSISTSDSLSLLIIIIGLFEEEELLGFIELDLIDLSERPSNI